MRDSRQLHKSRTSFTLAVKTKDWIASSFSTAPCSLCSYFKPTVTRQLVVVVVGGGRELRQMLLKLALHIFTDKKTS